MREMQRKRIWGVIWLPDVFSKNWSESTVC